MSECVVAGKLAYAATQALRYIERMGPAPFDMNTPIGGPPRLQAYQTLQQWFARRNSTGEPTGDGEWHDVPTVKEVE